MTAKTALKHSKPAAKAPAKKAQPARKSASAVVAKKVVAVKKAAPAKKAVVAKKAAQASRFTAPRVSVVVSPRGYRVYGSVLEPKHRTPAEIAAAVATLD